jgi:dTDP-4-dehydrorhamnose 3,5-epimerase
MKFKELSLKDLYLVTSDPYKDERGSFTRLFCKKELSEIGVNKNIIQINHSFTQKKGTVRGMHYQKPPYAEMKMVRCIKGRVWDVAVDLRMDSPTFLKWHAEELSDEDSRMMIIPEGFAHGFQTLQDNSELLYLHTKEYNKQNEGSINVNDKLLQISWPLKITQISEKDLRVPFIKDDFKGI